MGTFLIEVMETLTIPIEEPETNRALALIVTKIDKDKPSLGEEDYDK